MSLFDFGPNGLYVWAGWLISALALIACALLVAWESRAAPSSLRREAGKRADPAR